MSASDSVHASLESIGFVQLALLFAALIAYGVALGEAFPARARVAAAAAALLAAAGFAVAGPGLADGVVLLALAVALVGAFSGATWLVARLLGLTSPARRPDAQLLASPVAESRVSRSVEPAFAPAHARAPSP